jgi:RNA polymerase sigma-70 factor (sigma-E family)
MTRGKQIRSKAEERAFEAFVAESGDSLLRIAVLLTCDVRQAEDVYQETLQRLAARWSRVDTPKAFCRRVMHHIVIDHGRAKARRPQEATLHEFIDPADERSGSALRAVELRPALLAALRKLTVTQRTVLVLRYFDDRSEAQVAELLDISPGTVKSTASRSMAHLRSDAGLIALFAGANTETPPRAPSLSPALSPDRKEPDHAHP